MRDRENERTNWQHGRSSRVAAYAWHWQCRICCRAFAGPPVYAQSHKGTLVLAIDFADTVTFDPAHESNYVAPLIVAACYECLVTMTPDDYVNVKPALATSLQRTPDGGGWRFTLRDGVKFSSGNVMTADDVKYSLDRELHIGDQPSQYLSNVDPLRQG